MNVDLLSGIALIAVGAFASGSFSMPFEKVKGWKWENHWLVYSLFAYVVVPLLSCLSRLSVGAFCVSAGIARKDFPVRSSVWNL